MTAPNRNITGRPGAAVACGFFDGQRLCGVKDCATSNINQAKH